MEGQQGMFCKDVFHWRNDLNFVSVNAALSVIV